MGPDGKQLGIFPISQAIGLAKQLGYDLVEVAPNVRPPVCRIVDSGKFIYEQSKKEKKKKHSSSQMKEIRFSSKIGEHDYNFKVKHIRNFLEKGHRVKVSVFFRGREITHSERGKEILDKVTDEVRDIAKIDKFPSIDGRYMTMILVPEQH